MELLENPQSESSERQEFSVSTRPQEIVKDGKTFILYKGKYYSPQFRWFLFLNEMLDRGYQLKCFYRNREVRDKPTKFTMDLSNGVAPEMPTRVQVLQQMEVRDELSNIFGNKVETEVVMDIENLQSIDPAIDESLDLVSLVI